MGTYATTTALDDLMPGVDFSATATLAVATKCIDQAEAEVNKYLSKRYDLSASTFQTSPSIPPLVRSLTEQLSEGYLWKRLSRGGANKEQMARGKELVDGATNNLKMIQEYKVDLVDTAGSAIVEMDQAGYRIQCTTSDYTPTFNEDDELSWVVDDDKLQDISDERR